MMSFRALFVYIKKTRKKQVDRRGKMVCIKPTVLRNVNLATNYQAARQVNSLFAYGSLWLAVYNLYLTEDCQRTSATRS